MSHETLSLLYFGNAINSRDSHEEEGHYVCFYRHGLNLVIDIREDSPTLGQTRAYLRDLAPPQPGSPAVYLVQDTPIAGNPFPDQIAAMDAAYRAIHGKDPTPVQWVLLRELRPGDVYIEQTYWTRTHTVQWINQPWKRGMIDANGRPIVMGEIRCLGEHARSYDEGERVFKVTP